MENQEPTYMMNLLHKHFGHMATQIQDDLDFMPSTEDSQTSVAYCEQTKRIMERKLNQVYTLLRELEVLAGNSELKS